MNKCMMDFGLQESEKIVTITFTAHLLKVIMYARRHQNESLLRASNSLAPPLIFVLQRMLAAILLALSRAICVPNCT